MRAIRTARGGVARTGALALAAVLAACASPAPPPKVATAADTTQASPYAFDGAWHGVARLTRAEVRTCPRSVIRTIHVDHNILAATYRSSPTISQPISAEIQPDGIIHGSDGAGTIDGHVEGDRMDVTVASRLCETRFLLKRQ